MEDSSDRLDFRWAARWACLIILSTVFGYGLFIVVNSQTPDHDPVRFTSTEDRSDTETNRIPEPEPGAPTPDNPATGCVPIPGIEDCSVLTPKDVSQDPYVEGNAPMGGGSNVDPRPGKYIAPEHMVRPPSTPRVNPPPPSAP